MDERIVFEIFQSCENMRSVRRMSVFGLLRYGLCKWEVGRGVGLGSGGVW